MGNAPKLTPCTQHMDIKTISLCKWVDRDLMHMEQIDTSINTSQKAYNVLSSTATQTTFLGIFCPNIPQFINHLSGRIQTIT
jgi:hypothetical protein